AITWPEVLKREGYATALVGKWHLGEDPAFHPHRRGFDDFFGFLGGGNRPMNPTLEDNGRPRSLQGSLPDLLVDDAIGFVERHRDRPFAVLLHFRAPHLPYGPVPEEDSAPFKESDPTIPDAPHLNAEFTKDLHRKYYASIHAIDRNLGRLLAKLDELKLTNNTIILFTSDHGYNVGHHTLHGKGNGVWIGGGAHGPKRPNMFDTSVRTPLLVRWPGVVKPQTRIEQHVSNIDTFATVLGMLGVAQPPEHKQHGRDFSPLLRGASVSDWPTDVFAQYDLHNAGLAYMRMIRTPKWKLVRHHLTNGHNELYDLSNDPEEKRNRYFDKKVRDVRDALQQRLTAWQESIDDPVLKLDANRSIEPGPPTGE
ncbi:MAG: sulfatase-like hydrolase/transferase, partial [Planctomycetota bacterium]|nr:sulfatase-like hydrolase/transferase [Planctomycetota bacterium]